jgi:hypothetical protein
MKSSSKCAMLLVAVLLAASLVSAPASAQADEDKGLSSGALAVLLFSSKAKPHLKGNNASARHHVVSNQRNQIRSGAVLAQRPSASVRRIR